MHYETTLPVLHGGVQLALKRMAGGKSRVLHTGLVPSSEHRVSASVHGPRCLPTPKANLPFPANPALHTLSPAQLCLSPPFPEHYWSPS